MSEVTIRKVENGYILEHHHNDPYEDEGSEVYVATTDRDMIDHVTEVFFGGVLDIVTFETTSAEAVTDFEDEPARPQPNSPQEAETAAALEALAGATNLDSSWGRQVPIANQVPNGDAQDG